jgi:hypothetical protein
VWWTSAWVLGGGEAAHRCFDASQIPQLGSRSPGRILSWSRGSRQRPCRISRGKGGGGRIGTGGRRGRVLGGGAPASLPHRVAREGCGKKR